MALVKLMKRPTQKSDTGLFSVPAYIARAIPEGAMFEVELTDDGILYRFSGVGPETRKQTALPEWLNGAQSS